MATKFRTPRFTGSDRDQFEQMKNFLHQHIAALQYEVDDIRSSTSKVEQNERKVDEFEPTDFVIKTGTKNIVMDGVELGAWRYRKWNSGAIDFNGVISVAATNTIQLPLPFPLKSCQFNVMAQNGSFVATNAVSLKNGNIDAYEAIQFDLIRLIETVDVLVNLQIMATGKYK